MADKKGQIMNKQQFMQSGDYAKEHYEGLLIGSDIEQGCYNIGVQLGEDQVLIVDQSSDSHVRERIQNWAPQVQDIQRQHRVTNDLGNYLK
ncbi:MAG: hypothetical protein U9N81_14675 [Bacillota bacterium]|nr:hypothetical protein [Bacillota bacterium]